MRSESRDKQSMEMNDAKPGVNRETLANIYLNGSGLEVGALHCPLPVPPGVSVRYVDIKMPEELQKFYIGLTNITVPDIIADGEKLDGIADESQDFVIANHLIEHCEDPIGTIKSFLRVVKRGGILYLTLPDKRFTFDVRRPATTFDHLLRDYREGPEWSHFGHHVEFHRLVFGITDEKQVKRHMEGLAEIHYHAWTQIEMLEIVIGLKKILGFDFDLEAFLNNPPLEAILILRKGAAAMSQQDELDWLSREREAYRKRYPDFEF